jgi:hypothetical protein
MPRCGPGVMRHLPLPPRGMRERAPARGSGAGVGVPLVLAGPSRPPPAPLPPRLPAHPHCRPRCHRPRQVVARSRRKVTSDGASTGWWLVATREEQLRVRQTHTHDKKARVRLNSSHKGGRRFRGSQPLVASTTPRRASSWTKNCPPTLSSHCRCCRCRPWCGCNGARGSHEARARGGQPGGATAAVPITTTQGGGGGRGGDGDGSSSLPLLAGLDRVAVGFHGLRR